MINLLVKPLMPFIKQSLEGGKIDELLHQLVAECKNKHEIAENETVDFVLSFENNVGMWFIVTVATNENNVVRPLESMELKKVIELILSKL